MKNYSMKIKEIREANNLTQSEFGNKIGKSAISIRKYESGKFNIPIDVIKLIDLEFNKDINSKSKENLLRKIIIEQIKNFPNINENDVNINEIIPNVLNYIDYEIYKNTKGV